MSKLPKPPREPRNREVEVEDRETGPALPDFFTLVQHDTVTSTSDIAKQMAADGASEGTLVCAREQTKGRGRHGKRWVSPPGNVYMSMVLRPKVPMRTAPQIGFVAAAALADVVFDWVELGTYVEQKWPNDVLIDGKKVSGILLESSARPDGSVDWIILGIGLNIHSFPEDTDWPATALSGKPIDRIPLGVIARIAEVFLDRYRVWLDKGFPPIRESWLSQSYSTVGEPLSLKMGSERVKGIFETIDESGALVLRMKSGELRTISYGEVFPAA